VYRDRHGAQQTRSIFTPCDTETSLCACVYNARDVASLTTSETEKAERDLVVLTRRGVTSTDASECSTPLLLVLFELLGARSLGDSVVAVPALKECLVAAVRALPAQTLQVPPSVARECLGGPSSDHRTYVGMR
jgi:hypothetical protein